MTHYPWHSPKPHAPTSDRAQAEYEQDMRQGSSALLTRIAYLQAEREHRLAEFYKLTGGNA